MGYERPQQGQGFKKPASKSSSGGGFGAKKPGGFGGGAPKKQATNKPAFRLAPVEKDDEGKFRAVKGGDGKTIYVGAAWTNDFGGYNIKIERDIPAGTQVRAYPTDDDRPDRQQKVDAAAKPAMKPKKAAPKQDEDESGDEEE